MVGVGVARPRLELSDVLVVEGRSGCRHPCTVGSALREARKATVAPSTEGSGRRAEAASVIVAVVAPAEGARETGEASLVVAVVAPARGVRDARAAAIDDARRPPAGGAKEAAAAADTEAWVAMAGERTERETSGEERARHGGAGSGHAGRAADRSEEIKAAAAARVRAPGQSPSPSRLSFDWSFAFAQWLSFRLHVSCPLLTRM